MENLKEKTAKSIAWGAVNNGTTQVLNLIFGIVLAWKLSEADYGIVALITVFTTLAGCIQAAGFSQALANLKVPTFRDYNAVCWFNIIAGISMYGILFLCAPLLSIIFHLPILTDVSRLAFLSIPLSALGIVPNAKLWIELRNRELAIAAIVSLILSGSIGMWLAFHHYGYWSLVWQQLIFIGTSTLIKYYFTRWMPKLPVDFAPIKQMFGFSSKLLLTNILTVTSQQVQTFIFGNMLPINTVGQFSQANKWNTMGHSFISNTMAQVAQPVLTNADDEEGRQQRVFRKMLRFTSLVCFPLMFGLALVAHEYWRRLPTPADPLPESYYQQEAFRHLPVVGGCTDSVANNTHAQSGLVGHHDDGGRLLGTQPAVYLLLAYSPTAHTASVHT